MTAGDELKRLEREIESRSGSKQPQASSSRKAVTGAPKRRDSFDRTLADGALGGAAGVLIGYAIGRFRP